MWQESPVRNIVGDNDREAPLAAHSDFSDNRSNPVYDTPSQSPSRVTSRTNNRPSPYKRFGVVSESPSKQKLKRGSPVKKSPVKRNLFSPLTTEPSTTSVNQPGGNPNLDGSGESSLVAEFDEVINHLSIQIDDQSVIEKGYLKICQEYESVRNERDKLRKRVKTLEQQNYTIGREYKKVKVDYEKIRDYSEKHIKFLQDELDERDNILDQMRETMFGDSHIGDIGADVLRQWDRTHHDQSESKTATPIDDDVTQADTQVEESFESNLEQKPKFIIKSEDEAQSSAPDYSEPESDLNVVYGSMFAVDRSRRDRNRRIEEWTQGSSPRNRNEDISSVIPAPSGRIQNPSPKSSTVERRRDNSPQVKSQKPTKGGQSAGSPSSRTGILRNASPSRASPIRTSPAVGDKAKKIDMTGGENSDTEADEESFYTSKIAPKCLYQSPIISKGSHQPIIRGPKGIIQPKRQLSRLPFSDGIATELVLYISALQEKLGHPELYVTSVDITDHGLIDQLKRQVRNGEFEEDTMLQMLSKRSVQILSQLVKDFFIDNCERIIEGSSEMMNTLMQAARCANHDELKCCIEEITPEKRNQLSFLMLHLQAALDNGRSPGELASAFADVIVSEGSHNKNDPKELIEKLVSLDADFYRLLLAKQSGKCNLNLEDEMAMKVSGFPVSGSGTPGQMSTPASDGNTRHCSMLGPATDSPGQRSQWKTMVQERQAELLRKAPFLATIGALPHPSK